MNELDNDVRRIRRIGHLIDAAALIGAAVFAYFEILPHLPQILAALH